MLSEKAKTELIDATSVYINRYGAAAVAKAAPHFADEAVRIAAEPDSPEHWQEYGQNREEVNQIIVGLLGMM